MAVTIELECVSAAAAPYKTEIKELYIPAFLGKAGILENHLPYITLIKSGEVYYKDKDNKNHYLYIEEGFLEAADNKITLISDSLVRGEDLDENEVSKRLKELYRIINASLTLEGGVSPGELEKALKEEKGYRTRLEIVKKIEKK